MRMVLAAFPVLLVFCLAAAPAAAGFKVCNRTPHEAKVAIGFYDGTAWSSRGWWTVAPKACTVLLPKPLDGRYYYLYATDNAGSWDGKTGFCVATTDMFSIRGRGECEAHGFDRKGFFEIDTRAAQDYTQTLSD